MEQGYVLHIYFSANQDLKAGGDSVHPPLISQSFKPDKKEAVRKFLAKMTTDARF
jgi:hypothetical protein